MDLQINYEQLKERTYGNDFSYVFMDNDLFSATEYKVLQNQKDDVFVKCMKLLNNGNVQLYYATEGYENLSNVLKNMNIEQVKKFILNFLKCIIDIRNNGFLHYQNIVFSSDKIFVDTKDFKIKLTYIPIVFQKEEKTGDIQQLYREKIIEIINTFSIIDYNFVSTILQQLSNVETSVESVYRKILNSDLILDRNGSETPISPKSNRIMKLTANHNGVYIETEVEKDVGIIGRNTFTVVGNGVFHNKTIGRIHCKVENINGSFYVEDLNSVNGTFLNGAKLEANVKKPIVSGDKLRLANVEFSVTIN